MKIEIKSIFGDLIFEGDFSSVAEAVTAAIAKKANLRFADLSFAKLKNGEIVKEIERPFFSVGPLGSDQRTLLAFTTDKGRLTTGCFFWNCRRVHRETQIEARPQRVRQGVHRCPGHDQNTF